MSFLSKLAFWKKDDLGDLDKGFGNDSLGKMDFGSPSQDFNNPLDNNFGNDNMGMPQQKGMPDMTTFRGVGDINSQQGMNQSIRQQLGNDYMNNDAPSKFSAYSPGQSYKEVPQAAGNPEIEIISAKLDAIKAMLDSINMRLGNLERLAYGDQDNRRKDNW